MSALVAVQALYQLEYPDRLQKLLLTPNREMGVELVVQVRHIKNSIRSMLTVLWCFNLASSAAGRGARVEEGAPDHSQEQTGWAMEVAGRLSGLDAGMVWATACLRQTTVGCMCLY